MPQAPRLKWHIAVHRWAAAASGIAQERVRWSDDATPWPSTSDGEWVSLREMSEEAVVWTAYHNRVLTFAAIDVSSVNAGTGQFSVAADLLRTGDGPVRLAGDTPPAGFSGDLWVIRDAPSQLRFASSFLRAMDGQAVEVSDAGALPLRIEGTATTVRVGSELNETTYKQGTQEISVQVRGLDALAVAKRLGLVGQTPKARRILTAANVGLLSVGPVQNVGAALNAGNYEPRAAMTVRLSISDCHIDAVSAIESAIIETEVTGSLD